jgi:hypothetical protein
MPIAAVIGSLFVATLLISLAPASNLPNWSFRRGSARVIDAITKEPIADAIVTIGTHPVRTDAQGRFGFDDAGPPTIHLRAVGYQRTVVQVESLRSPGSEIRLTPFHPRGLYLTVYGIGDKRLRNAALQLIDTTELNALVIDLKGDRGLVPYRSRIPLASSIGAQRVITIGDLNDLVKVLRVRGIYTIARIVVFKDNLLAGSRPDLAIHRRDGSIYRDREGLAWTNPYSRDVWNYNIDIALEAARSGFDEIQFDYVRLPDTPGLAYERPWTAEHRQAAVEGFLREARQALAPFNVFLAADVFGYICWNRNDTKIGQQLEHIANIVDYTSPMLYPSAFQFGIPGYRNPVEHPYQIIRLSLDEAAKRTSLSPLHFRPWLQGFRDYAFGGRPFTGGEVRAQIKAAEDFGSDGWMIWNPRNQYSSQDFARESSPGEPSKPRN